MSDYEQEEAGLDDDTASIEDEDLLAAQEEKGYGEDEGEREESLDEQ
jgi:hypothetical protein